MKIAYIYAGQGAQKIGMGKDVCEKYKCASDVFDKASNALSRDVKKLVFESDEETLKITENTQPAIVTVSQAITAVLNEKGIEPSMVAGLSLGEYNAFIKSGAMSFEEAVCAVEKRGRFMQEAVPLGEGAMAAIIGAAQEDVQKMCEAAKASGYVAPANFNCPGQIVVSGEAAAVKKCSEIAKEFGAKRVVELPVSAPFHCKMMQPAADKLMPVLGTISFGDIKIPVVTNKDAAALTDKNLIKDNLIKQVVSPVKWQESVLYMISAGIDTFIEIGPGKALSGFVKKISKDVRIFNAETRGDIDLICESLL